MNLGFFRNLNLMHHLNTFVNEDTKDAFRVVCHPKPHARPAAMLMTATGDA
jgi:hypothetical protein